MLETHDCLIVGGGPAGLSAAIYMGRFLRRTIVVDGGEGRSSYGQLNENYLGFPEGIHVDQLRELGRRQAERFGVEFFDGEVERLEQVDLEQEPTPSQMEAIVAPELKAEAKSLLRPRGGDFLAHCGGRTFRARTVILCTGVEDIWPPLPNVEDYVGRTLFWCITCDGFRTIDKHLILFGRNDDAASSALQFQAYTKHITFVSAPGTLNCSDEKIQAMEATGVEMVEGEPVRVEGTPDKIEAVCLADGRRFEADLMFSLLGCEVRNKLAKDVGAQCDGEGYVKVDEEGYTSVPGLFAAGDLSRMHTHQVVAAAHEGAEAAQTANYYLYADYQKV